MAYQYDDPDYEVDDAYRRGDVRYDGEGSRRDLIREVEDRMRYYGFDAREALEDELQTGRWPR